MSYKNSYLVISLLLMLFSTCTTKEIPNHFTSYSDTLVLKTDKLKGIDIFQLSAGDIYFRDTSEGYKYSVIFPANIRDVKIAYQIVDYTKYDSASYENNSICILSGVKDKDTIFIVDENNNKDFRDDTIRSYKSVELEANSKWQPNSGLIKCKYFSGNENGLIEDSSWIWIAKIYKEVLLFAVSQHFEAAFTLDDQQYVIGIADRQCSFTLLEPTLTILSQNGRRKDSLITSELCYPGEYVKLKDSYYRFDTITPDGKYLSLIKENDFDSKVGTQVGMLAPDFHCLSVKGDTISSETYRGRYLLLANLTACWSKIPSYNHYKDLTEKYKDTIAFIGIDNSPIILKNKIEELNLIGEFLIADDNQDIQDSYRQDYSSRICFLISPEGRIIDKFEISNWEINLESIFKNE